MLERRSAELYNQRRIVTPSTCAARTATILASVSAAFSRALV
jgi:hypothetical protein